MTDSGTPTACERICQNCTCEHSNVPTPADRALIEAWSPEPRPIAAELEPHFDRTDYTEPESATQRMSGIPLMDRLDEVMRQRLVDLKGIL